MDSYGQAMETGEEGLDAIIIRRKEEKPNFYRWMFSSNLTLGKQTFEVNDAIGSGL